MFAVVHFVNEDHVDVVPTSWLKTDEKSCYWPPSNTSRGKIDKIVKKMKEPNPGWQVFDAFVMGKYDTFNKANAKCTVAEFTSNLESDSSNCSSEYGVGSQRQLPKVKPTEMASPKQGISAESSVPLTSTPRRTTKRLHPEPTAFELEMLTEMREMKKKINKIYTAVCMPGSSSASTEISRQLPSLPLKTVEEVTDLENKLDNNCFFKCMADKLSSKGGENVGELVRGMLRCLMTNELAFMYNWAGRGEKRSFRPSSINHLIFAAVRISKNGKDCTSIEAEKITKNWLKYAGVRINKQKQ